MSQVPEGWYPNPDGSETFMYWDGASWTGQAQSKESLTGSNEAPSKKRPDSSRDEIKVGLFGGKRAAQAYADEAASLRIELAELTEVVRKYGIENDVQRELKRKELLEELAEEEMRLKELKAAEERLVAEANLLRQSIVDLRTSAGLQELGLYDFEHPAESSVDLANELESVRAQIKSAVSSKTATSAAGNFTFNNSTKEGAKFVRDMSALLLRAYNAEAENCVKGAKAGNQEANVKRLNTAVSQIEKQGQMISLKITPSFHKLRLKEIDLATRYLKILAEEKSAEAERRAQLREDAKVARELERETKKLTDNKQMVETTLQSAIQNGDSEAVTRIQAQLEEINKNIDEVNARAANRRMGHVYVISNIGAFGPDVVKIGMTRRMDPNDRVRELGDASVPFRFDVHAMIFSDDAVGLETSLHRKFESRRVNRINAHREFFRVTPEEVLEELKQEKVVVVSYVLEPEALEYRASIGQIDAATLVPQNDLVDEDSSEEGEAE